MRSTGVFAILLNFGILGFAQAEVMTLPVQKSSIEARTLAPNPPSRDWIALGVSSQSPEALKLPAAIGSNVEFQKSSPSVYASYSFPSFQKLPNFNLDLGISYLALTRSAPLDTGGVNVLVNQSAQIFSGKIGLTFSHALMGSRLVSYQAGIAALPTTLLTGSSAFGDGSADFNLLGEVSLGSRLSLEWMGLESAELELNAAKRFGKIAGAAFAGVIGSGGVRVAL